MGLPFFDGKFIGTRKEEAINSFGLIMELAKQSKTLILSKRSLLLNALRVAESFHKAII
jgi:hypothetical protein